MAVASVWGTGPSIPVPQLRPVSSSSSSPSPSSSSSFDCSLKKSFNARIVLGRDWAVHREQCFKSSQTSILSCRCSPNNSINSSSNSSSDWDWNRWTRYFSEIEQTESLASILKFQLEDSIERQDFQEAAKLKAAISEATSKDNVAEIMSLLKNAIDEERYPDASLLCRYTGSGLVGWWVGFPKDSDYPFGSLMRVTPSVGRFVGRTYSPRQLITASPGTPLFEIFVVKDADKTYNMQVAFFHRSKGSLTSSNSSSNTRHTKGPSTSETQDASLIDINRNETKAEKIEDKSINIEGATEEGIASLINSLREKIPELKLMKVDVSEEVVKDVDAVVKQLMQEDDETSSGDSNDEASDLDDTPDKVAMGEANDATEDGKDADMKVFIGGVFHNKKDSSTEYVRLPAEIKDMERDSFVLHVPRRSQNHENEGSIGSEVKVAAITAKGVSELMPPAIAKAFFGYGKVSSKVSRDLREIVKLAASQAQKRGRLPEYTTFSRITTSEDDLDPFDGLYVGAFGPYGTEIVQLKRKYGNWSTKDDADNFTDVEFFEYVEAVKLTGDLNVPAGQVTFRAKIGKGNRKANRGLYPDELGVVASYGGQGRIAEFWFQNPKWVDGELLQLSGKGMGLYTRGPDLGFLYVVPEQSFMVLFSRLILPE